METAGNEMVDEEAFAQERWRMMEEQLAGRDIHDRRVLEAMYRVPRHAFVPAEVRHMAYADGPLPIGSGQTISQPYIVAYMSQLLKLTGSERVLEVGTGSGYQAAVLALLAREVHTIERHPDLAERAALILQRLGLKNVFVHIGDGTLGLAEKSPYDAILVTAAAPEAPSALLHQLSEGGRLVIPVGGKSGQVLERWTRQGDQFSREELIPVAFVPLLGHQGWKSETWDDYI